MNDYVNIAIESLLNDTGFWRNSRMSRLVAESEFILSSLESGCIASPVWEAVSDETAKKAIGALRQFLNSVMAKFMDKVAGYYEKYVPWVIENEERIKEAANKGSITMAPYWKGEINKDKQALSALPNNAFKYPFKADDISFASNILPSIKIVADMDDMAKLTASLKNKFRFGVDEPDNEKIKKEELRGPDLVQKVESMIEYVKKYRELSNSIKSISNQWQNAAQKFEKEVTESAQILAKDSFMLIEMTGLCSTDLALLEGFDRLPDVLFEEDGKESNSSNDNGGTSLTSVENNVKDTVSNGEKKVPSDSQGRYQLADKFTRLAFSAFMTACEERFIVYIKVISQVLGESPKTDGNKGKDKVKTDGSNK